MPTLFTLTKTAEVHPFFSCREDESQSSQRQKMKAEVVEVGESGEIQEYI
jgi:hypothetical protein